MVFFALFISLSGCSNLEEEYYEVHYLVANEEIFRHVDPSEGKELLSQGELLNEDTFFIYLYIPETGVTFTYEQYFGPLGERFVYKHAETGKYYIKVTDENETIINQFLIDKEAHDNE